MKNQNDSLIDAVGKVIRSEYGYHPHQFEALQLAATFCRLAKIASIAFPFEKLEGSDHPALAYHIGWHPEPAPLRRRIEALLDDLKVKSKGTNTAMALARCARLLWQEDWTMWGTVARQVMQRAVASLQRANCPVESRRCERELMAWTKRLEAH